MKLKVTAVLALMLGLNYGTKLSAQTISKEELTYLTSEWKGERFADGRPKIAENLLERAKKIGIDDAWTVLKNLGYTYQFEQNFKSVNDNTITGRAVTASFLPSRPDLLKSIMDRGPKMGHAGNTNSWPIDVLTKGDLYVGDGMGKIAEGTLMGSTLGNAIFAKSGTGVVFDASVRDVYGLQDIKDPNFNAFVREFHPSFLVGTVLMGLNTPIRIGAAVVMPGDLVIANKEGVLFVPAHLAEQVVATSEFINRLDAFKFEVVKAGTFTAGQLDNEWNDNLKVAFLNWLGKHPELGKMTRAELDVVMSKRTW